MARAFTHCTISPDSRLITLGVHLYPLSCLFFHITILYFTEFYKFFKILQNDYCWGRCAAQMRQTKQDGLIHLEKPISRTLVCICVTIDPTETFKYHNLWSELGDCSQAIQDISLSIPLPYMYQDTKSSIVFKKAEAHLPLSTKKQSENTKHRFHSISRKN